MDTIKPKITSNRQKKMDIVAGLSENFGKAKAVVFTNYTGLTHKQIEGLKKAIKPLEAEYVVAKNSLVTKALSDNKITLSENDTLKGPTGTLFLYGDVIEPLKSLAKTIKELNLPSVKFGIIEKDFVTADQVIKLSSLPNRETLLVMLVGGLKSPIFGLHRALNWNLQKLVMTLNEIAKSKPATPAPASNPTSAEETEESKKEEEAKTDSAPELAKPEEEKTGENTQETTKEESTSKTEVGEENKNEKGGEN